MSRTLLEGFEARIGSKALGLPRKAEALVAYLAPAPACATQGRRLACVEP